MLQRVATRRTLVSDRGIRSAHALSRQVTRRASRRAGALQSGARIPATCKILQQALHQPSKAAAGAASRVRREDVRRISPASIPAGINESPQSVSQRLLLLLLLLCRRRRVFAEDFLYLGV